MVKTRSATYANAGTGGRSVQQATQSDFRGGLHVSESPLNLAANDVSMAYDVEFPAQGGVSSRRTLSALFTGAYASNTWQSRVRSIHMYERLGSASQLLFTVHSTGAWGGGLALRQSTAPTTDILTWTPTSTERRPFSVVMNGYLYLFRGHGFRPVRWDGTSSANMNSTTGEGFAYAATAGAGSASNVPRAKVACVWQNSLWVANVLNPDGSTTHPNRVRWSWPDDPERWPDFAYEDIDIGERNDEIVAMIPDGERLLIFKKNSIHIIVGQGPTNFTRYALSQNIGAAGFDAVAKTESAVYFYDHPAGVHRIQGGKPERVSTKVDQALKASDFLVSGQIDRVSVKWDGADLVYVSAAASTAVANISTPSTTELCESFVYNTRNGTWTRLGYGISDLVPKLPESGWPKSIALASVLTAHPSSGGQGNYVMQMEYDTMSDVLNTTLSVRTTPRFRAAPLVAGDAALLKRWRKIGVVASPGAVLVLKPTLDYAAAPNAAATVTVPGGSGNLWGAVNWGSFVWSSNSARAGFDDSRVVGTSRSLEVEVDGAVSTSRWHLSALMTKYIPRQRRD